MQPGMTLFGSYGAKTAADVLEAYGIHPDALITLDWMPSDWGMLEDYPMDLVIGIEI